MAKDKKTHAAHAANKLARLAAVQALYESSFEQQTPGQIIRDAIDRDFAGLREEAEDGAAVVSAPDPELFAMIVQGVAENAGDLDGMIAGALDARFSPQRLEILLRMILRAGAFELHHNGAVPSGIVINDYVDVAHAFFDGKEPGLVNAVLDKLVGNLRGA